MKKLSKRERVILTILLVLSFIVNPYLISHSDIGFLIALLVTVGGIIAFTVSEPEDDSAAFSFIILLLTLPGVIFTVITMYVNTYTKKYDPILLKNPAIVNEQICGIDVKTDKTKCVNVVNELSDNLIYLLTTNQVKKIKIIKTTTFTMFDIPVESDYNVIVFRKDLKNETK